jgi:hypothetical protein
MLNKAEELVGKWFSNLLGEPNDYFFVLEVEDLNLFANIRVKFILVKRRTVEVRSMPWDRDKYLKYFGDPIKDELTITKINKKAIKGLFK